MHIKQLITISLVITDTLALSLWPHQTINAEGSH